MSRTDLFERIISEYKEQFLQKRNLYDDTLLGEVTKIKDLLLDDLFKPSLELKRILNKQIKRAVYPMEVAIVGQFSSGKSTFLNALLSKSILPSGIVPVTSKVIYINYGESYKLRVTYKSGVHEYQPIENIAQYSDQRVEHMNEIKYLSIYAPVEILKEISFVDTPGLNSQSQEDTQSTKKVFQDAGGIIWLTLIDNAGKRSEQEVLEHYMSDFKTKTLCLLNQKDKFTEEQVAQTTAYIERTFEAYFSKVIPISAKMALEARALEPKVLIDNAVNTLMQNFKAGVESHPECKTMGFFTEDFTTFKEEVTKIEALDSTQRDAKLEASNIQDVLQYINENMRPNAVEMKAFRIKNDLRNICDILMNSYQTMAAVYDALSMILQNANEKNQKKLQQIQKQYSMELSGIFRHIEDIFQHIADEIYVNIKVQSKETCVERSSFLQKKLEKQQYESFSIDSDTVLDVLFYQDNKVQTRMKVVDRALEAFERQSNEDLHAVYTSLEEEVLSWQHKYLLLFKNREISSDLEFSHVKRFASKVYENILNTFHTDTLEHIETLNKKSAFINGALSFNLMQTVQMSMVHMQEKIQASEEIHKDNPDKFSIYKPTQADILERLKKDFDFEGLEALLLSQNSYLHHVIKESKKRLEETTEKKQAFIEKEKAPKLEKIEALQKIKESI